MKNSQQGPVNPGEMLFKTDLNGVILTNFLKNIFLVVLTQ